LSTSVRADRKSARLIGKGGKRGKRANALKAKRSCFGGSATGQQLDVVGQWGKKIIILGRRENKEPWDK